MDNTLIDSPVVAALRRRIADLEAENARTYGVIARLRTLCGEAREFFGDHERVDKSRHRSTKNDYKVFLVRLARAAKGGV